MLTGARFFGAGRRPMRRRLLRRLRKSRRPRPSRQTKRTNASKRRRPAWVHRCFGAHQRWRLHRWFRRGPTHRRAEPHREFGAVKSFPASGSRPRFAAWGFHKTKFGDSCDRSLRFSTPLIHTQAIRSSRRPIHLALFCGSSSERSVASPLARAVATRRSSLTEKTPRPPIGLELQVTPRTPPREMDEKADRDEPGRRQINDVTNTARPLAASPR